jgi:hypothetical protein
MEPSGTSALLYERRLGSLAAVVKEAQTMDADAGIRISGRYRGVRCYAFVSRFGQRYTVMVYEKGATGGVGKRLASEELEGLEGLRAFLGKIVSSKLEAFAY